MRSTSANKNKQEQKEMWRSRKRQRKNAIFFLFIRNYKHAARFFFCSCFSIWVFVCTVRMYDVRIYESIEHSKKKTMVGVRMTKLFVEMFAAYMISCMKAGRWCVRRTEKQMKWNEANEFRLKQHKNTNIHVHTHIHSSRFMAYTQKAVLYWMVRSRDWSWGKAICIKDYCIETERSGDLLTMCACVCVHMEERMNDVSERTCWLSGSVCEQRRFAYV